jgi:hypothetical protein
LEVGVRQVFKGGNCSREETIIFLLTNESYLPLQKLYGLNEKLSDLKSKQRRMLKSKRRRILKSKKRRMLKFKQRRILNPSKEGF